jgi:hypothetical protein
MVQAEQGKVNAEYHGKISIETRRRLFSAANWA